MPRSLRSYKNAAAIVKLCEQELEPLGFVNRKGTTSWRRTNVKLDILRFDIIPRAHCKKWGVPSDSFGLQPSCLFPFLPRLGHASTTEFLRPEIGFGQIRLSINRGISQSIVKAPNIWWAGDDARVFDLVAMDVLRRINEKVLPFFGRFEDVEELLRTLLEEEDTIGREGVWDFGKRESPKRLLYTGFAAIECCKWDSAISSLRACEERTMTIPEPIGKRVRAEILPYVVEGLACAERKCAWFGGIEAMAR